MLSFSYVYPKVAEYGGGGSGQSDDDTLNHIRPALDWIPS